MTIVEILKKHGIPIDEKKKEISINCLFCGDHKGHMYVNTEKGVFCCHKCGESGNIWKLMRHFGMKIKKLGLKKPTKIILDKDYDELYISSKDESAIKFLKAERGFTSQIIKRFKLGTRGEWIAIPYFRNNELVNVKYRHIKEKRYERKKGGESILFNVDNIDKSKPLIITEGEFDCISADQMGFKNTISISLGATGINPDWFDFFDSLSGSIYLALDNDERGEEGASKLAERIGFERCHRIKLPCKDFNECLMSGISKEEIEKCISNAIQYKPKSLYSAAELFDEVDIIYQNREELSGIQMPWPGFNEHMAGLRRSEITVVTGDTGSGKTTFVLNIMYDLLKEDRGTLIISSEIPAPKILVKLSTMHNKKLLSIQSEKDYMEAISFLGQKKAFFVKVHGKIDISSIRSFVKYCKRKYDIEYVMLDHLHFFLDLGKDNMVQEIERFMRESTAISKETGVHIFMIAHPAKLSNTIGKVKMNDLKGSSAIKQDADNIITIWRNKEKEEIGENFVLIEFEKVRDENGKTGIVKFKFLPYSLTYEEI